MPRSPRQPVQFPPVSLAGNVTWTEAGYHGGAGALLAPINPWAMNEHTVTGTRYNLEECSVMDGQVNAPGTITGKATCNQAN